jgi:hypothetical protein
VARPIGSRELSIRQIRVIVEKTLEGLDRPAVAEAADVGTRTAWRYQKDFDLV